MSAIIPMERIENWRSQFATSKRDKIGLRHPPMALTEQGVAMLSRVLRVREEEKPKRKIGF